MSGEKIDLDAEFSLHVVGEAVETEAERLGECRNQINIAAGLGVAASDGTEDFEARDAMGAAERGEPVGDFVGWGRPHGRGGGGYSS